MKLNTIDCHYLFPEFAAAYLLTEKSRGIFVECNTFRAVPRMMEALSQAGVSPGNVDYLIVTHAHLDHAGGCAEVLRLCPNAILLCHPKAAKHLTDPTKLIGAVKTVYGEETYHKLYGDILPVPQHRVRVLGDGEEMAWQGDTLKFLHTKGHADHHFCILSRELNTLFSGDAFGLCYPRLQAEGLFIFPSTSPTGFDPEEAVLTVERLKGLGVGSIQLTHYGEITAIDLAAEQLLADLLFSNDLMLAARDSGEVDAELVAFCETRLRVYFKRILLDRKVAVTDEAWGMLKLDIELNAAGIAHTAKRRRKEVSIRA